MPDKNQRTLDDSNQICPEHNPDHRKELSEKLRKKMKSKKSGRLGRYALVQKTKSTVTSKNGQRDLMDMLENVDMKAVSEAMKTREHQRKLKNFNLKM